jgi:adenylylsulfate kinase
MSNGAVVWITGPPASGKSTLAARLHQALARDHPACCVLDGDAVRTAIVPPHGYAPAERDAFYETLARLAALLARQGLVVIVAATSHRRAHREQARAHAPQLIEVYVRVPLEECERRDPKGLYAAARAGALSGLPGADVTYEAPTVPEVIARGGDDTEAVAQILDKVHERSRQGPVEDASARRTEPCARGDGDDGSLPAAMSTTMFPTEVAGLVAGLPAFADLDAAERAAVADLARVEHVPAGTTLFRESDPADDLRFIVEGRVSLGMRFGGRGEVIILSLGPGELLGWSALLGGSWTATARAVERSTLVRLPGAELAALCEREHDIGYGLMKRLFTAMAWRLHDTRLQLLDMFGKEPC